MKKINFLVLALFLSGCAIGPLVNHESARTVGDENHELTAGYGMTSYAFKWTYGITDNLDFGLQLEALSFGARAKYAFINVSQGWSFAASLGAGSSLGGSYKNADLIASYKNKKWEPYTTFRVVSIKTDPQEINDEDTGVIDFSVDSLSYSYGQYFIGTRYFLSKKWVLSVEGSTLFGLSEGIEISSPIILNTALTYRF